MAKRVMFTERDFKYVEKYNAGAGVLILSKAKGCSPPVMRRFLETQGCVIRKQGRPKVSKVPEGANGEDTIEAATPAPQEDFTPQPETSREDARFNW